MSLKTYNRSAKNAIEPKRPMNKEYVHLYFGNDGDSIRINHNHKQSFNPTTGFSGQDKINAYIFKLYVAKTKITGWDKFDPEDHNDYCQADA